jgi:hypothetical protein
MKDMGTRYGNSDAALIVGKDTVYVHSDIQKVDTDNEGNPVENLWQYNEIQYDKDEYIELLSKENEKISSQMTDTQLALVEVYELLL